MMFKFNRIFLVNTRWFKCLSLVITFILLADLFSHYFLSHEAIVHFFRLKLEKNLPSLFSTLQLMVSASILFKIYEHLTCLTTQENHIKYWKYLSFTFFFLAADEWFSIHDPLGSFIADFFGKVGDFFDWTLIYFFIMPVFFLFFLKFIKNLPTKTTILFIFSGCLFLLGSMGFEILGYFQGTYQNPIIERIIPIYFVSYIEEFLEIIAIFIFNYSAFLYFKHYLNKKDILLPKKLFIFSTLFFGLDILGTFIYSYL